MNNNIKIGLNRTVAQDYRTCGVDSENNVTTLVFEYPELINDIPVSQYAISIEFEWNNEKFFDAVVDRKYVLKSNVTKHREVKCQLVFRHGEADFRSNIFELRFNPAINAESEIDPPSPPNVYVMSPDGSVSLNRYHNGNFEFFADGEWKKVEGSGYDDTAVWEAIANKADKTYVEDAIQQALIDVWEVAY